MIQTAMDIGQLEQELQTAYQQRSSNLSRSIEITEQLFERCKQQSDELGMAKVKNQLGLFYLIQGKFHEALELSEQALLFFEQRKDSTGIAAAKYNIASVHYRTNKYHQALILLIDCLEIYRQQNDYHNQARTLKSMGTIYEYFTDQAKAIESYEGSIFASRKIQDIGLESNALNPLSSIYLKQGKEQLAIATIEQSIAYKKQANDIRGLAFALYGRAKIFLAKNDLEKAHTDLEACIAIQESETDMLGLAMAYRKMGLLQWRMKNSAKAYEYLLRSVELSEKHNEKFIRFKVYFNLYELASSEGNQTEALEYLEKYIFNKESVINSETYSVIKSYEALSEIEKLQRETQSQREKNEIIQRKNEELDSFFYRISHDLKGPISSLLGLNNIVNLDVKDEASRHLFSLYHSQVLRMNDIVMGLINLTEIKNTEKLKTKIDFDTLVTECVNSCQYLPRYTAVKIEKDIQAVEFFSEWAIINTILQNLIENAIKYARELNDSFIHVTIRSVDEFVEIVVRDNGQGIPNAHLQNIFNIFYRANQGGQGSGLGLYILKRAVERLNGSVHVVSEENRGSTFTVKLPR